MPSFGRNLRRLVQRITVLAVIGAVFAATIWLARRPSLVWWTSAPMGNTARHVRLLVPHGWEPIPPFVTAVNRPNGDAYYQYRYYLFPVDRTPKPLHWIFPIHQENSAVMIDIVKSATQPRWWQARPQIGKHAYRLNEHSAIRTVRFPGAGLWVYLHYEREDSRAFDATYEAISNSLRIE